uniref:Sidoreflexin n=1 Tax=Steinernema glaseri TaxID=37863 RepID=A0A1I8A388_9BILA
MTETPIKNNNDTIFGFPKYPNFRLNEPRFPQDTFLGRYLHYLDVIDPRTLFVSDKRLKECVKLLNDYRKGEVSATNVELWHAQKIKQAILHPDTGEKVLPPFRMSGFVPFGWITVTGMLLPNPSWPTLLFWQWMNQSHNACVNYCNRNASKDQDVSVYVKAYGAAVTAAITTSASLTYLIKRAQHLPSTTRLIIQRFVPLPATSLASTLNVLFMRSAEMRTGIVVYDESEKVVGISKVAAKKAVYETAATRAFLPVPLLLIPPCIMPLLERTAFVQRSPIHHLLVNAAVCTISFAFSLPIALALFPQNSSIATSRLESEIQERTTDKFLFFNRGL